MKICDLKLRYLVIYFSHTPYSATAPPRDAPYNKTPKCHPTTKAIRKLGFFKPLKLSLVTYFPRQQFQVANRKLLPTEEKALLQWILSMGERGFPPRISTVRGIANILFSARAPNSSSMRYLPWAKIGFANSSIAISSSNRNIHENTTTSGPYTRITRL